MDSAITEESSNGDDVLSPNSIPVVDLRRFSQPEILSFSAASSSYGLSRFEEDLVLKIDPSSFKESAGSRRQTYSRLRLAPRKLEPQLDSGSVSSHSIDSPRLIRPTTATFNENSRIVGCLRDLFAVEDRGGELFSIDIQYDECLSNVANINDFVQEVNVDVVEIERKRKRGTEIDCRMQISANEYDLNEIIMSCGMKREENANKIENSCALANAEGSYGCKHWNESELFDVDIQWISPYTSHNGQLRSLSTSGYSLSPHNTLSENASNLECHDDREKNEAVNAYLNIQTGSHFPLKLTRAMISADHMCSAIFFSKDDFLNNLQLLYNNTTKIGNFGVRNSYHYHHWNYMETITKFIKGESERTVNKPNNLYFIELSYMDSDTPVSVGVYESKYHIGTYSKRLERSGHQNTRIFDLVQEPSKCFCSIDEIRELLCHFLEKLQMVLNGDKLFHVKENLCAQPSYC